MRKFSFKENTECPTPLYQYASLTKGILTMKNCAEGQYRKGFLPYIHNYDKKKKYATINDTEIIITMCLWTHEQLLIQVIIHQCVDWIILFIKFKSESRQGKCERNGT